MRNPASAVLQVSQALWFFVGRYRHLLLLHHFFDLGRGPLLRRRRRCDVEYFLAFALWLIFRFKVCLRACVDFDCGALIVPLLSFLVNGRACVELDFWDLDEFICGSDEAKAVLTKSKRWLFVDV